MSPPFAHEPAERAIRAIRVAFSLLTILPTRLGEISDQDLAESRFAFPVVGIGVGLLLAALSQLLGRLGVSQAVSAFLLVATGVSLSGGLHLDGLADTFDGLFLGGPAERRLAVMRDPHIGTFGVSAIVLTLLGRYAALSQFTAPTRAWAIFAAAVVGRTLLLVSAGLGPYARREGTGRVIIESTTANDAQVASLALLVLVTALLGPTGFVAGLSALGLTILMTVSSRRRLGGLTGDILGTLAELGDVGFLVVLAVLRPHG